MIKQRKTPVRTCIGCRESSERRELVRIVRSPEGDVHVDPTGRANGRGAYVCASEQCIEAAFTKRRLSASLRVNLRDDDLDRLRREFEETIAAVKPSQGR